MGAASAGNIMTKKNDFYYDLEANFRGTREEIMDRLEVYLPFIQPLFEGDAKPKVFDLGCGRGEWLELTQSFGAEAHGVDLDDGMLQDCFERKLSAKKQDAIEALRGLPDNSQSIVSGFHIAEHLPFDVLLILIEQAYRVLQPGGLLILETPNAENVNVGALTFHFDPTHVRPLPPGLLSFLPRREGFCRSLVIRLQEDKILREASQVKLLDVFQGVSPDYAVVAQKEAKTSVLEKFNAAFEADYGLTIETLAERFENHILNDLQDIRLELQDIRQQNIDYQRHLLVVHESTSWRITKPLRLAGSWIKDVRSFVSTRIIKVFLKFCIRVVLGNPMLRRISAHILHYFPRLASWLKKVFIDDSSELNKDYFGSDLVENQLSEKTNHIYQILKEKLGR